MQEACVFVVLVLVIKPLWLNLGGIQPSVSGLYLPWVCIMYSCCHSRHEWTHLWVGCICLECALYVLVVTRHEWTHLWVGCICLECALYVLVVNLGMSGPVWEWGVSASSVHYMFLLSISAWVTHLRVGCICLECAWQYVFLLSLLAWVYPSESGMYLPRVCIICSCCQSRHEWTHLRVGCICLECALYVLVVTLGMSGPISEWGVSASSVHYVFLLSLLAWVDPSESGMYLPQMCIVCSCCQSRHEWTHLRVGCICLKCVLCVLVTHGMSGPIWEWGVSASSVHYVFLLSILAWVDPSESGVYLPRVCVMCYCCQSRHEWTHLRVGCICLECALYVLVVTRHEWTHLRVGCICLECALYVLVVTLGMSGPIWEWDVSASSVCYMFLLSLGMSGPIWEWGVSAFVVCYVFLLWLSAWGDPSQNVLCMSAGVCIIIAIMLSVLRTHFWVGCVCHEFYCTLYFSHLCILGVMGSSFQTTSYKFNHF